MEQDLKKDDTASVTSAFHVLKMSTKTEAVSTKAKKRKHKSHDRSDASDSSVARVTAEGQHSPNVCGAKLSQTGIVYSTDSQSVGKTTNIAKTPERVRKKKSRKSGGESTTPNRESKSTKTERREGGSCDERSKKRGKKPADTLYNIESTSNKPESTGSSICTKSTTIRGPGVLNAPEHEHYQQGLEHDTWQEDTTESYVLHHKEFRMYPLEHAQCVITVRPKTQLVLAGKASLRALHGSISCVGYDIQPSEEYYPFFSPAGTSRVTLAHQRANDVSGDVLSSLKVNLQNLHLKDEQIRYMLKQAKSKKGVVIFILRELHDSMSATLATISNYSNMFDAPTSGRWPHAEFCEVADVGCYLAASVNDIAIIQLSHEQLDFINTICTQLKDGQVPVVLFCGGKNLGKSTMARHMINTALNHVSQVSYLECDVGQTELSPPACVALHNITRPLLGPPFTHQWRAKRLAYVGDVTPIHGLSYYTDCVKHVYGGYRGHHLLVVNTMGWNKGFGLEILADIIRLVCPTHVVQLNSDRAAHNMEPVDEDFVYNHAGIQAMSTFPPPIIEHEQEHSLTMVASPVPRGGCDFSLRPVDHRNLALLSHLSEAVAPKYLGSLHAARPLCVPWAKLALCSLQHPVANSAILLALNANVVALARGRRLKMSPPTEDGLPRFLSELPVCLTLALGIVRAVDMENRSLLIVSPLTSAEMRKVNIILLGALELPQSLLLNQPVTTYDVPYVGEPRDVIGATNVKTRRRHLQRGNANSDA